MTGKCEVFPFATTVAHSTRLDPYSHAENNADRRLPLIVAIPTACSNVMYDVMLGQVWPFIFKLKTVGCYF